MFCHRSAPAPVPRRANVPDGCPATAENEAVLRLMTPPATPSPVPARPVAKHQPLRLSSTSGQRCTTVAQPRSISRIGNRRQPAVGKGWNHGGSNIVSTHPRLANIALTPGHGCVFSWRHRFERRVGQLFRVLGGCAPPWLRLRRIGNTYVGECSADGVAWTIVGNASPATSAVPPMSAYLLARRTPGASDRFLAKFDNWSLAYGSGAAEASRSRLNISIRV